SSRIEKQNFWTRNRDTRTTYESSSASEKEIKMMSEYDYVVMNDDVELAVDKIKSIVQSEHCKRERIEKQYKQILEERSEERRVGKECRWRGARCAGE